jgi:hypothetical protein
MAAEFDRPEVMKSEMLLHFQRGKLPDSLPGKVTGWAEAVAQSVRRGLV